MIQQVIASHLIGKISKGSGGGSRLRTKSLALYPACASASFSGTERPRTRWPPWWRH